MDPSTASTDNIKSTADNAGMPPAGMFSGSATDTSFPIGSAIESEPNNKEKDEKPEGDPEVKTENEASSDTTSTVVTSSDDSSSGGGGRSRRRVLMIGIGLVLMLAGIVSGTVLLQRQSFEESFAWDCELYRFEVNEQGVVTAINGSSRDLPEQEADVYINDQLVATLDVPALSSGEGVELGVVSIGSDPNFTWRVEGNKDCVTTGEYEPDKTAQCLDIKAFDENWDPLTLTDLAALNSGDLVRFTISGSTNSGTFDAARFTINGELMDEVTDTRPGTDEFFYEYEVPAEITDFDIDAEIMHSEAGWI